MQKGKKKFVRQEVARYKKLKKNWRKPDGMHSKMRKKLGGKSASPSIGWGTPAEERGLHPCGSKEVLVNNLSELAGLGEGQAVRIASRVGRKKRIEMLKKAKEMKLKVLNPALGAVTVGSADELERFSEIKEYVTAFSLSGDVEDEELMAKAKKLGIKLERGK